MEKAKPISFLVGIMLLILVPVIIYLSTKGLLTILSASSCEDGGTIQSVT